MLTPNFFLQEFWSWQCKFFCTQKGAKFYIDWNMKSLKDHQDSRKWGGKTQKNILVRWMALIKSVFGCGSKSSKMVLPPGISHASWNLKGNVISSSGPVVKHSPVSAGDTGSIPRSGRSPGGGYGNPFQYSCLDNPMEKGAWQATVWRVAESRMWVNQFSTHMRSSLP